MRFAKSGLQYFHAHNSTPKNLYRGFQRKLLFRRIYASGSQSTVSLRCAITIQNQNFYSMPPPPYPPLARHNARTFHHSWGHIECIIVCVFGTRRRTEERSDAHHDNRALVICHPHNNMFVLREWEDITPHLQLCSVWRRRRRNMAGCRINVFFSFRHTTWSTMPLFVTLCVFSFKPKTWALVFFCCVILYAKWVWKVGSQHFYLLF